MKFVSSRRVSGLSWLFTAIAIMFAAPAQAQTSVPAPWVAADIGSPVLTGSTTHDNGVFTVSGGGAGIGNRSDQFHFLYQAITGDTRIVARVDRLIPADPGSKIGVMMRTGLDAGSAFGFGYVSGGEGIAFLRRRSAGARAVRTTVSGSTLTPVWLAVQRAGTTITASASVDGSSWVVMGTDSVPLGQTAYVGIALTAQSTTQLAMADVSRVSVSGGSSSTPPALQSTDIGSPAAAGSMTVSNGVYTIRGAGADINGTSDQFRFVYRQITGDTDVVARIDSLVAVTSLSKAGVMVRESLSPSAAHAFAVITNSSAGFRRRTSAGATTYTTIAGSTRPPGWMRLVRTGNRFQSFYSADGQSWISTGTADIPMAATVLVGVAVTSGNTATTTTAGVSNLVITGSGASGSNQSPTVSLTSPSSGQSWSAPASIALAATAADADGTVARVEFFSGATLIGSDASAPYTATWSSVAAGSYSLTAVAIDNTGARTVSAPVPVTVTGPNQAPTVSLTSPSNGQSYAAPANVTMAATASDPEGRMSRVDFFANNTLVGSDTSSPYSATWSAAPAGSYSLTAVALDANGGRTVSAAVSITVGSTNQAPTVTITAPVEGQTAVAPASFTIAANASDPEGRLARVEFFINGALLGSDATAPFSLAWGSVAAGSHRVSAVGVDAEGNRGVSATINVTVTSPPTTQVFTVVFTASSDHDTNVTSYRFNVYAANANPATAQPIAVSELGKPAPDGTGTISVDRTAFLSALPAGNYLTTVTATGPYGSTQSAPVTFTR